MYKEEEIVAVAKRENNNKRKYLVVNKKQGKHVPVSPSEALEMYSQLAEKLVDECRGERLLFVGFAETATAIGAAVAAELGSRYIQTTRETVPGAEYLYFSESHSHATEQKLVKDEIDKIIDETDRIVFVEDEVTTGNTIFGIITIINEVYGRKMNYTVASILNGMDQEAVQKYSDCNIKMKYLLKTNHYLYTELADAAVCDGKYYKADGENLYDEKGHVCLTLDENQTECKELAVDGYMNARRLVDADKYKAECTALGVKIIEAIDFASGDSVLVAGTEEFMYPALIVAEMLEKKISNVKCHSTTRSPILVSSDEAYPLHCRYQAPSFYDPDRITFIYDIGKYDKTIVITDASDTAQPAIKSMTTVLAFNGNEKIYIVKWEK